MSDEFGLPPGLTEADMRPGGLPAAALDECAQLLARREDPNTSRFAAARAKRFKVNHEDMIVGSLGIPGNAYDIARRTGLTHVQVDRRIKTLIEAGRVLDTGKTKPGPNGAECRVYDQVTGE